MPAPQPSKAPRQPRTGCLVLFALPFAGFGLFAAFQAFTHFAAHDWKKALFLTLFAVVFGSVGFGLIALGLFGSKKVKEQQALEAAHPEEPWLWRADWARGEIKSHSGAIAGFFWFFTLIWNGISTAAFIAVLPDIQRKPAVLLVLLFPLVGIFLLIAAVRQTLRVKRFGESTFQLATVPGLIGGPLAGVVLTARPIHRAREVRLKLACFERHTGGKNSSEHLRWEDEKVLTGEVVQGGGIPVFFNLPFDAPPTATLSASRSMVWRLQVRADVVGTDYEAQFEVPIFQTALSRPDAPALADPTAAYEESAAAAPPPGVTLRAGPNGGTAFEFAAARNKSAAFGLLVFTLIWTGAVVLMIKLKAPILFPIIFGLIDVLLLLFVVSLWTSASRVVADATGLNVTRRWLFSSRKDFVAAGEIKAVETKIGMSSGSTAYYDLFAVTLAGKKMKLASGIQCKKDSTWLAQEINQALGRK